MPNGVRGDEGNRQVDRRIGPLFTSPDLILHVYDRWQRGTADEQVSRMFGIRDTRKAAVFVMMGGRAAVDYIKDWTLAEQTPWLRRLPSLASLPEDFWEYLAKLRVRGTMRSVPEGTRFDQPIGVSQELHDEEGEGAFDLTLVELTDVASVVALVSPAITALLDAQIAYGALLLNDRLTKGPPVFWMAERIGHPLWGRLAAEVEAVFGSDVVTQIEERRVYVAIDPAMPTPAGTRHMSGEWQVDYDHRPARGPNGVSTREMRRKLAVEIHLLFIGPRRIDMRLLGDADGVR